MSKQTKTALEDALRAHLADERPGHTITAWEAVVAYIENADSDSGAFYWRGFASGQHLHVSEGLLHAGLHMVEICWRDYD